MASLPPELLHFIDQLRPLFRVEVFQSFCYLLAGILIGEAKYGTVRASVFAPPDYWPQRLSDLFCRHKLSPQAFMAKLVEVVLSYLYAGQLPRRLFWLADSTLSERPYVEQVACVGLFHRTKHIAGRAKHLKGHCYVFAAHLYEGLRQGVKQWASVLVGALLYVKGVSIPSLVVQLAGQLRLPAGVRHVWIGDRGIVARPLLRGITKLGQFVLGRLRCNQVVYFAPSDNDRSQGRPKVFGQKCRVDQLLVHFVQALRKQKWILRVCGKDRNVHVFDAPILLRGVWPGRALPARVIVVEVPGLKLKPWYLTCTDLELDPLEAAQAYNRRSQIEVNFDEVKELGLGHYQGRSARGVRRWPLFVCVAQTLLKFIATGILSVHLPSLNWTWYRQEDTVGQVRRRLIERCRPRISRTKGDHPMSQKSAKTA